MNEGARTERCADVLGTEDSHHLAPPHHETHQRQRDRRRYFVQPLPALRQSTARARLLIVNGVAKAAVFSFLLHGWYCREALRAAQRLSYNAGMQTIAIPPGPAEGFDIGGSEESLARLQDYFGRFGDIYRVFAPEPRSIQLRHQSSR